MPGTSHGGLGARCRLALIVVALIPPSAAAGEPVPSRTPLRNALADVGTLQSRMPRAEAATLRRSRQSQDPATQSPRFFRTRAGILVVAVMAAGVGYALYSTRHDRIHSPGKQ